ncbi:MAG: hypothetical protein PHC92_10635 [Syntrophomonadaceae bacterium]|nr:hypothetical protein [Syntrophomonadaceae bacterium]MDD3023245.1 hypothetical protein [Syntrophomonadaceae bacterium]
MRERSKRRHKNDQTKMEKKWEQMERNQHRNIIISLLIFAIMAAIVIYRKVSGNG